PTRSHIRRGSRQCRWIALASTWLYRARHPAWPAYAAASTTSLRQTRHRIGLRITRPSWARRQRIPRRHSADWPRIEREACPSPGCRLTRRRADDFQLDLTRLFEGFFDGGQRALKPSLALLQLLLQ